ncbi:MAG: fumarylacetoacetate hydrolase family protein [candidate division Zixibacteria bacterium]|nr:fumarylacetoacetate hydrolase family protein [candidate division Zixibacteria bacterium]
MTSGAIKKTARFKTNVDSIPQYGFIENDEIKVITSAPWLDDTATGKTVKLSEVTLLAPVVPSKVVCVGLNYHAHVDASMSAKKAPEQPMLFLKPPSAVIGPNQNIVHPAQSKRVDFEAELAIVIGKRAVKVSTGEALSYIFGYTCANDVTARDLQKTDGQWGRAKGFDTFCPVGPWIVSGIDSGNLKIEGILNGVIKQSGNSKNMIFDIPFIVSYISGVMTLEAGDLILTGTPAGIEAMKHGDKIEVNIEQIGCLINQVISE